MERISINHKLKCVRVWEGGKKAEQTYFTEKNYGSMEAAYKAAVEYEANLKPENRLGRCVPHKNPSANSKSGIVGVNPYDEVHTPFAGWRATWTQLIDRERKSRSKKFSYSTYGNKAFSKAKECREEMVERYMLSN